MWRPLTLVLLGLCGLVVFLVFAGALWLRAGLHPVGAGEERVLHIPAGTGTAGIAHLLRQNRLIRDELAFGVALRQWGFAGKLRAGYYRLSPRMSGEEIARTIAEGRIAKAKVTIPEGFTVAQIGEKLEKEGLCTAEEFLEAANPATVSQLGFSLEGNSLEGYLFPDTYVIEYGTTPADIVRQIVADWGRQVASGLKWDFKQSNSGGRTRSEIMTIASMIEREAQIGKDRPLIASVIYNRLRKGMRLQIDATVIYALGAHRPRLTYRDLQVDSPFNTYRYRGLPPHPICNPGLPSIRAALHPAQTDYLFYVARHDGSHVFTRTYEEHRRAIREVRGQATGDR